MAPLKTLPNFKFRFFLFGNGKIATLGEALAMELDFASIQLDII